MYAVCRQLLIEFVFSTFTTKRRQLIRVHARLWYTVGHGIAMGVHDLGVAIRVLSTLIFVQYWLTFLAVV